MSDISHTDIESVEPTPLQKQRAIHAIEDSVTSLSIISERIGVRLEDIEIQLSEVEQKRSALKQEHRNLSSGYDFGRFGSDISFAWAEFFESLKQNLACLDEPNLMEISSELFDLPGFERHRLLQFQAVTSISANLINDYFERRISIYEAVERIKRRKEFEINGMEGLIDVHVGRFPVAENMAPKRGYVIYLIFSEDNELLYVGQTKNPRDRLRTHWSNKQSDGVHSWVGLEFGSPEKLLQEESRLIRINRPRLNISGNPDRDPRMGSLA